MIEVASLTRRYGSLVAVDDVSFAVNEGEVLGFLGPNGAGKTTMIRLIAGLLAADSGEVRVLGDPPGGPAVLARTGYMPQTTALYEELTVRENVAFFAACYGRRDPAAADSAVEFVGLSDRSG
ncbi:MAG: ABC transporter ATP-binding protein, partial [Candidatus Poseidoniia archaeon]|nr:ABC transporter ATP-binding protein [Candidatus Poseidoniia archaeon]